MSTLTLGSGLEMFEYVMDTEAEATVSIKSGDDETPMESSAAETIAEDSVAVEEKTDDDVDTAMDNVEQTEKAMSYAFNEFISAQNIYNTVKQYGASAGFLDYLNRYNNFTERCRSMNVMLPAVENYTAGTEAEIMQGAKNLASKAWAKIKEFFIKLKEFFIQLGRTIYSKIMGQEKRIQQLLNIIDKAPDKIELPSEIADVKVYDPEAIIDGFNKIDKLLASVESNTPMAARAINNGAKQTYAIELSDKKISIGENAKLKEKAFVRSLLKRAQDGFDANKIKGLIDKETKEMERTASAMGDVPKNDADPARFNKQREIAGEKRKALMAALKAGNNLVNATIYIGNLFARGASIAESKRASNENYKLMRAVERLNKEAVKFNGLTIGNENIATDAWDAIKKFFARIKTFILSLWDRFIKWIRNKEAKTARLLEKVKGLSDTVVKYSDNADKFKEVKVITYNSLKTLMKDLPETSKEVKTVMNGIIDNSGTKQSRSQRRDKYVVHSDTINQDTREDSAQKINEMLKNAYKDKKPITDSACSEYGKKTVIISILEFSQSLSKHSNDYDSLKQDLARRLDDATKFYETHKEDAKGGKMANTKKRISAMTKLCDAIISSSANVIISIEHIAEAFISASAA